MSASIETSNLTLAYINTANNVSQLNTNMRDISNNLSKVHKLAIKITEGLNISFDDISGYKAQLLDISNNL